MSCPCDTRALFPPLAIPAGLDDLPRQIGGFPEFRRAMLQAIGGQDALAGWRARDRGDLGLMLIEMWAYVSDALAFYDAAIANESYLRTARLRPSVRRLVGLLGYVPRPASASSALLVALAQGNRPLDLPAGTAFRSQAFGDETPQVFELDAETRVHALNNRWRAESAPPEALQAGTRLDHLLIRDERQRVKPGDPILVSAGAERSVVRVSRRTQVRDKDGAKRVRLDLEAAYEVPATVRLDQVVLSTPTQTAGLWSMGPDPEPIQAAGAALILDGLYRQLKAGQLVLLSRAGDYRWFELAGAGDRMMAVTTGCSCEVEDTDGEMKALEVSPVLVPATQLALDFEINSDCRRGGGEVWTNAQSTSLMLHHALVDVGTLVVESDADFAPGSDLILSPAQGKAPPERPADGPEPAGFVLEDAQGACVEGNGTLDGETGRLALQATDWPRAPVPPVSAYGNLLRVSRGESVRGEVLGDGDAARGNQRFSLAKGPLTYLTDPDGGDEHGLVSTLRVRVDGVLWREVPSFFGQGPEDPVYRVRQDDEDGTWVEFGDGLRGARLPTGRGNVTADYRFGAGAATPPAGAIDQLARPVKGLDSVRNPFAAEGGDDREAAGRIREHGPASALLLGRAVSAVDFAAAAAGMADVVAVRGEWRWSKRRQRPVVQLWIIGGADAATIDRALRRLADPAVALDVVPAKGVPLKLSIEVEIDAPTWQPAQVEAGIRQLLTDPIDGLLAPANIGIGRPLYRSRLVAAVMSVAGTVAVTGLRVGGEAFTGILVEPGDGCWYDLSLGWLHINGEEV